MPISEFCNPEVVCCQTDASITEVAALMRKHHVGDVIVTGKEDQARVPLGIVTDRDIVVEAIAPQVDLNLLTAGDIMNSPLATVQMNEGLFDTLRLMKKLNVRRMPVVREDKTLFGIVTADDLIHMLVDELSTISSVLAGQIAAESQVRR
jgi:signal-transduction protein with cAMP-binding, CBS, and nucleotidyltransferase domain